MTPVKHLLWNSPVKTIYVSVANEDTEGIWKACVSCELGHEVTFASCQDMSKSNNNNNNQYWGSPSSGPSFRYETFYIHYLI